ncbi:MAG: serine hydrolase [Firmicutes bacterium]|nr:serine hydrolase [Bacillota bacterium]
MLLEQELFAQLAGLTGQVAIYLEDIQGSTVFSVNPERPFPAASLIKVLILAALLRAAAAGELSLEEKVTLKPENRVGGAGALSELSPDVSLPLRDLGTLMIVQSDNAATNEILDRIGFAKVNT